MYGYIYKTTNLINGKIYIGKHMSQFFDESYKGSGKYLWRAIYKYGWDNFKVELIEECQDEETLNKREKYWIATLHSLVCDGNYNIQDGGNGGWGSGKQHPMYGTHRSQKTKENISKATKLAMEKWRNTDSYKIAMQKMSESLKKVPRTEEWKRKISESNKGKHTCHKTWILTPEQRQKAIETRRRRGRFGLKGSANGMYGKHMSEEAKQKARATKMNSKWMTNGSICKLVRNHEEYLSKGWKFGRIIKHRRTKLELNKE